MGICANQTRQQMVKPPKNVEQKDTKIASNNVKKSEKSGTYQSNLSIILEQAKEEQSISHPSKSCLMNQQDTPHSNINNEFELQAIPEESKVNTVININYLSTNAGSAYQKPVHVSVFVPHSHSKQKLLIYFQDYVRWRAPFEQSIIEPEDPHH